MISKLIQIIGVAAFTIIDFLVLQQLGFRPTVALIAGAAIAPFALWALQDTAGRALGRPAREIAILGDDYGD